MITIEIKNNEALTEITASQLYQYYFADTTLVMRSKAGLYRPGIVTYHLDGNKSMRRVVDDAMLATRESTTTNTPTTPITTVSMINVCPNGGRMSRNSDYANYSSTNFSYIFGMNGVSTTKLVFNSPYGVDAEIAKLFTTMMVPSVYDSRNTALWRQGIIPAESLAIDYTNTNSSRTDTLGDFAIMNFTNTTSVIQEQTTGLDPELTLGQIASYDHWFNAPTGNPKIYASGIDGHAVSDKPEAHNYLDLTDQGQWIHVHYCGNVNTNAMRVDSVSGDSYHVAFPAVIPGHRKSLPLDQHRSPIGSELLI